MHLKEEWFMVSPAGIELEPFSRRESAAADGSREAKS